MKFGLREICNVVFRAKSDVTIGGSSFKKGQPVLYIDTAKTSTLEGAATTVYATGGRGNTRLIAWEGEKTLTFTVEDALLSPIGFSILSGAGLIKLPESKKIHVHTTSNALLTKKGEIDLTEALLDNEQICGEAPIFIIVTEEDGSITGEIITDAAVDASGKKITVANVDKQKTVMVDYYITKNGNTVSELQIDAGHFAGFYYVEADTLFRTQNEGKDLPAVLTLPNVKIQSNFTFSMASTGDPSTFTFTMDAFPGYTYFDQTKKVLCVIQIVEEAKDEADIQKSVMPHEEDEDYGDYEDSVSTGATAGGSTPTTTATLAFTGTLTDGDASINYDNATIKPTDGLKFTYTAGSGWDKNPENYGITVTGTPDDGDTITVTVVTA